MSYFPDEMPVPVAGPDDGPFWEACRKRELRIQCCADCGTFRHPPVPVCYHCRSQNTDWKQVSGDGEVFSYTIATHPTHPAVKSMASYNVAVVMLDGAGDVRLISNVMEIADENLSIGMRVKLCWDQLSDGQLVPRFVPAQENAHG